MIHVPTDQTTLALTVARLENANDSSAKQGTQKFYLGSDQKVYIKRAPC